jgi:hypothetical protein
MSPLYADFIRDIVISIHANIRELNDRKGFADPEELDHIEGKLIAYQEVLTLLRASAAEHHLPLSDLGL